MSTSLPHAASSGRGSSHPSTSASRRTLIAAGIGAFALQGVVLFLTISLGLFWGMWLYFVAILQTVLGFGVIGWLLSRRRPIAALLVPFACAAVTLGLLALTNVFWPERLVP